MGGLDWLKRMLVEHIIYGLKQKGFWCEAYIWVAETFDKSQLLEVRINSNFR